MKKIKSVKGKMKDKRKKRKNNVCALEKKREEKPTRE